MAVKAPEPGLAIRVHGLHPLQGQGRRADTQPFGLCGAGRHDRRVQEDPQHHGRHQREFEVLAGDAERPEEPGSAGCAVLLRRRAPWVQGGDRRRVPPVRNPEVCHPHAAQLVQVCELQ